MRMEMSAHPFKVAGAATIGAALFTALVLFIVLEVLWIRLFARKLRSPAPGAGPSAGGL